VSEGDGRARPLENCADKETRGKARRGFTALTNQFVVQIDVGRHDLTSFGSTVSDNTKVSAVKAPCRARYLQGYVSLKHEVSGSGMCARRTESAPCLIPVSAAACVKACSQRDAQGIRGYDK
jgi:hypothetical protein